MKEVWVNFSSIMSLFNAQDENGSCLDNVDDAKGK
jgi:hypothetical protein